MKLNPITLFAILAILISATGCKKDATNNNAGYPAGKPTIPSDAAGAFYAIRLNDQVAGNSAATAAWFGSYKQTQTVGNVRSNDVVLSDSLLGSLLPWYQNTSTVNLSGNDVDWSVVGNSAVGVTSFDEIDQNTWPTINFSVPGTVVRNNGLTFNFTATNSVQTFIVFTGTNGTITQTADNNSTTNTLTASVSLSAAELNSITVTNDQLRVKIIVANYISDSFGGKKYYFVKEVDATQYTTAQ